jgi:hypothetical protein
MAWLAGPIPAIVRSRSSSLLAPCSRGEEPG